MGLMHCPVNLVPLRPWSEDGLTWFYSPNDEKIAYELKVTICTPNLQTLKRDFKSNVWIKKI